MSRIRVRRNQQTDKQKIQNRKMTTSGVSGNKRTLTKARSTDDTSSQQHGSLSVILNIPGLNTHLLSFSSATDLSRLIQCNRALQSMIDESFDLELERDVHLLQQMEVPSGKIAQFREQWPRLKNGKAKIVCYYSYDGQMREGDDDTHLNFEHKSVVNWLRQFVSQEDLVFFQLDEKYREMNIICVECGKQGQFADENFISADRTDCVSEGQFKCTECFKSRDSGLITMLLDSNLDFDWEVTNDGPFDCTFSDWGEAHLDGRWARDTPHSSVMQRMKRKTGVWLVNLLCSSGPSSPSGFWFLRLQSEQ